MPRKTASSDLARLLGGIKPGEGDRGERPKRREAALRSKPAEVRVETTKENMVSVSLMMPRELFERYNAGKSRGRFRDAMIDQLWKKFE
jgi:hypothetical protein